MNKDKDRKTKKYKDRKTERQKDEKTEWPKNRMKERQKRGVGVGHHNFWSIVRDDLWSK